MELNINPTTLRNQSGTTFFQITSATQVNIYGNLGIGTDIPLTNFHVENIAFDEKVIRIPTSSNIYNYRAPTNIYSLVPTGSIIIYPLDNKTYLQNLARQGWYECNGQTLLGSNFPVLSQVLAGQFGNTNPVQEYITLPDFQDQVGIGSTAVGYIASDDNPLYASPSNLYSNTIINTINPSYTISFTYDHLPNHRHYTNETSDPIEPSGAGSGTHTHTYQRPFSRDTYQGTPGRTIRNTPDNTNAKTSDTLFNGSSVGGGGADSHVHGSFYTLNNGNSCTPNLTNGTFTIGTALDAAPVSIRQPSITMIYLIKCL